MKHRTITETEFIDEARTRVIRALDGYMQELTGHDEATCLKDADLLLLFPGLDAAMRQVADRFNDPDSPEVGSAMLSIIEDRCRV